MMWLSRLLVLAAIVLPPVSCHTPHGERDVAIPTVVDSGSLAGRLPACATNCSELACPVVDSLCMCHSDAIRSEFSACLQASCSFSDILRSQSLTDSSCGSPMRDRGPGFAVMEATLCCITAIFVCLRFLSRYMFGPHHGIAPDDWVALIIGAVGISGIVLNLIGLAGHGLGMDAWIIPNDDLVLFMRYFLVLEILYVTLMMLVKLNLSLFYLDLFPGKLFRRMIWAAIFFQVSFGVAFVFAALFQCTPSSSVWMRFSDRSDVADGHCVDVNAAGWANAVIQVIGDFWAISIPMCSLYRLDLHWKQKIGAAVMFMTGFLVTIVSIVRLRSLSHFANSANPTWDQWDVIFWSVVEVNVGVICTCLPSIRLIVCHMFPRTIGSNLDLPHEDRLSLPPPPPRPYRRDEEEHIELYADHTGYPPLAVAVAKSSIEGSENSTSIRTGGSVEVADAPLPVSLMDGLNIRGQVVL